MIETITRDEYEEKLDLHAEEIAKELEGYNVNDAVFESLDADEWFFKRRFGPAAHGCIIEHSGQGQHVAGGSEDPREAIKRLAFRCMEADLIERLK